MARKKKIGAGTVIGVGVVGFVVIVAIDHYVLKGQLGISGYFNQLWGKLKHRTGQQRSPPIEAAPVDPSTLGAGGEFEGSPEEAALLEQEAEIAAREPETL